MSEITLHTLSIELTNIWYSLALDHVITDIFRLRILKKVSIAGDYQEMRWILLNEISSNVGYLTICGMGYSFQDLEYIFQCTSGLKYLNIPLSCFDKSMIHISNHL